MKSGLSPNELLMGLEAKSRADFEQMLARWSHADRLPSYDTVAQTSTPKLRFIVAYHPLRCWSYEFSAPDGGLNGRFDCRDSALQALQAHLAARR